MEMVRENVWEIGYHEGLSPTITVPIRFGQAQWMLLSLKTRQEIVSAARAAAGEAVNEAVRKIMTGDTSEE